MVLHTHTAENKRQPKTGPADAPQPPPTSPSPTRPVSSSPTPAAISGPVSTKWRHSQDSISEAESYELEGVRPSKRCRRLSPLEHELAENLRADKPESAHHSEELHSRPAPSSPIPAAIPRPAGTKRRHPQDRNAEAEVNELKSVRPSKQARGTLSSEQELSEENLRKFEILSRKDVDPTNNVPALKRTSSRRSITASETGTDRTRSTTTNSVYRYKHLTAAEIHIHADLPDYIETAINRIVNAPVSEERRAELRRVFLRPTDPLPIPRSVSAVSDVYKPNYARLNFGSPGCSDRTATA
jgi:hypothetical protein